MKILEFKINYVIVYNILYLFILFSVLWVNNAW